MRFRLPTSNFRRPGSGRLGRSFRQSTWRATLGVLVFLIVVLLAARFTPHVLATPAQAIAQPFVAVRNAIATGFTTTIDFFQSKESLLAQNAALEKDATLYGAVVAERDYFINQVNELQALLGHSSSSTPEKFVSAQVFSKPGFSPYDTMLVAAGSNQGVATGDLVFADPHALIGYVSSVSLTAATVTAYSTPGQQLNVLIGSSSLEEAASGLGGGTLEVRLPRNSPVAIGDIVTAAGLPTGSIVGQVAVATAAPADPYERVLFTSPLNIFDLSYVFIKTNSANHGILKK